MSAKRSLFARITICLGLVLEGRPLISSKHADTSRRHLRSPMMHRPSGQISVLFRGKHGLPFWPPLLFRCHSELNSRCVSILLLSVYMKTIRHLSIVPFCSTRAPSFDYGSSLMCISQKLIISGSEEGQGCGQEDRVNKVSRSSSQRRSPLAEIAIWSSLIVTGFKKLATLQYICNVGTVMLYRSPMLFQALILV